MTARGDELLSGILAEEQKIRQEISALEKEQSVWVTALGVELEERLAREENELEEECARSLNTAELEARKEADALRTAADAYRERIARLTAEELEQVIVRYLGRLRPEQGHDRQDEQT
ncbi:MAG: hypothetical protein M0023_07550 [Desulfobacteraceae bacterium]|nr:hypothetical protein [Desulfobacteraceae bacterium]